MTTVCEQCEQPASHFARGWFHFPGDLQRYQALCDAHWEKLLEEVEKRVGKKGRCARCYAQMADEAKRCKNCGFTYRMTDPLKKAA